MMAQAPAWEHVSGLVPVTGSLVFTRAKIYGGERYLKNHLTANDYYAQGERIAGRWIGRGADSLNLIGQITPEQFEALRQNLHPKTGQRLTLRTKDLREPTIREAEDAFRIANQRQGSAVEVANFRLSMKPLPNRVAFYDFQCSAQKWVSLVAVLADDGRVRDAHDRAATVAFGELERFAGRQRNTPTVRRRELTGNLCAAAFTHDASRALDPQLHTHFVVANATLDEKGRWVALDEYHMLGAIRYAGKVYQNELAREMKSLGYRVSDVRDHKGQVTGFEIDGISTDLCTRFAKRRAEIEREIATFQERHSREPSRSEIAHITRQTRDVKLAEITTMEVRAQQCAQLSPDEYRQLQKLRLVARERVEQGRVGLPQGRERQALRAAVAHLYERRSVAPVHEILAEALNQELGSVNLQQLQQVKQGEGDLVELVVAQNNPLLTECCTRYGLELERWCVAFVNATRNRCNSLNSKFVPAGDLSLEQRSAVRAILSTGDQVFSFRGVAGAGKTTTLKEVHRGLVEAGQKPVYIAPTASAAKVLQSEGFADATTVADFLQNVAKATDLKGAVIICDEAGLKSNTQGAALLHLAQRNGLRVLLVGDVRQHVSVEAGDFLRVLETHSQLGRCEVAEIRRQQGAPAYKAAVEQMAAGDARGGLVGLDALGWLHESGADYLQRAAEDYVRLAGDGLNLASVLLVAPTWDENHRLTKLIRLELQKRQRLGQSGVAFSVHDSLQWTMQQKRQAVNYRGGQSVIFIRPTGKWKTGDSAEVREVTPEGSVILSVQGTQTELPCRAAECFDVGSPRSVEIASGDKLLVRANDKRSGLINGQVLTVKQVEPDRSISTLEGVRIPPAFRQWCHGYVVTSHKAQGRTSDHVIVAAERLDAKAAYVACSRGKLSCSVHTPEKRHLLNSLPEGNRRAALDAISDSMKSKAAEQGNSTIAARVQAWTRLLPRAMRPRVEMERTRANRYLGRLRHTVRLWQRYKAFQRLRNLAPKREQTLARLRPS